MAAAAGAQQLQQAATTQSAASRGTTLCSTGKGNHDAIITHQAATARTQPARSSCRQEESQHAQ
jgi:hypothetical protein